ncbi:MAG: sulfatase [Bryobacterales bacterium]|nr:sulfatase [Bryobacterales bacterium]
MTTSLTRVSIRGIAALAALLSCGGGLCSPHILVFLTDDLGGRDTTVYGSRYVRTPNLEKLASVGMTFDRAFVASPACAPSRAALLTGLMPARNGAEANHTYPPAGTRYLPPLLGALGLEIAAFGKVSHGDARPAYGFDSYSKPRVGLADNVSKYLEQRDSDGPLCLLVGDRRPHVPWTTDNIYKPEEAGLPPYFIDTPETRAHRARYFSDITGLDAEFGRVWDLAKSHLGEDLIVVFTSDHGGQWPFAKWNLYDVGIRVPLIVAWPGRIVGGSRTDAMVSWIDLLPTLIELAGGKVPEGIDGRSFAAVLRGQASEHRTEIFTTHSGDGVFNVYPIRSIRTGRHKYIWNLLPDHLHTNHSDILRKDGAGAYWDSWDEAAASDPNSAKIVRKYFQRPERELYDLRQDPLEQRNLANTEEHAALVTKLHARLETWMREQGDAKTVFNKPYPADGPRPDAEAVGR